MASLFTLAGAVRRSTEVAAWFGHEDPLRRMVAPWFDEMRRCGPDVRELIHDGYPTACVGDAAFAYVAAFTAHANIGFFNGVSLDDPSGLLEGAGKRMRHVKLRFGRIPDEAALKALIAAAYRDVRLRRERPRYPE